MMSTESQITNGSLREQFESVAAAAQANLRLAIDLVMVHNESPVDGLQPRVSLN